MAGENVKNYFEQTDTDDNALVLGGSIYGDTVTKTLLAAATLAEINTGKVLLAGVSGKTITVLDFKAKVAGTFLTATSVEVGDTNISSVVISSTAIAGLTDGAILNETKANTTMGAGYLGVLTTGEGIKISKTGSPATGGTSITVRVLYKIS